MSLTETGYCLWHYGAQFINYLCHFYISGSDAKVYIGQITQYAHGVSGTIFYFKEDNQIMIENFTYDGTGPDAFFWVGTQGTQPSSNGILLPYPFQGEFFDSEELTHQS